MKNNALEKLTSRDLTYFGERAEPYFASHAIISGMLDEKKSFKSVGLKTVARWLQVNYYFYQFTADLLEIEEAVKIKLEKNGSRYIDYLIEKCLRAGNKLRRLSIQLGKAAGSLTDRKELAGAVLNYFQAVRNYTVFYQITFFDRPVMLAAEKVVGKYAGEVKKARKLFDLISVADRLTAAEHEQGDFLRLAARPRNEQEALAEKHAKKYGWLAVRYFLGDSWTKNDILKRLSAVSKKSAEDELAGRLFHRREREKMIDEAIENFSRGDQRMVKQIRQAIYLRTQRGDFLHESAARVRPLLNKVAEELNVTYLGLLNLSAREIILALQGGFNYKKHIKNRTDNFLIYHNRPDKTAIFEGREVEEYLAAHKFLQPETENVSEFRGQTGYKGKIRGIVKVVKANTDMAKVKPGDIIVTAMTTANLLPALNKASAFITDEGGITCHSAIIAREMRKPCIVGTKIATRVLRDGDIVEVDADQGIVRIIKKN